MVIASAALLLLAACGSDESSEKSDGEWFTGSPKVGEVNKDSLKGQQVVFASSGGIMEEAQKASIADPFTQQSGAKVVFDLADENKMRAMVDAKNVQWDTALVGWTSAIKDCGTYTEKLDFKKIDTSKLPKGVANFTGDCYVPGVMYGDLLVYNTEKYGDHPPTSWKDFFDTKNFPGKRGIPSSAVADPYFLTAAQLGAGVAPEKVSSDPMDLDQVFSELDKVKDDAVPWETGAQVQQLLESGEIDMAWVYSGRAYAAQAAGAKIAPVWGPDSIVAFDPLVIPKGAPHPDATHAFLNYYLGKSQQEGVAKATSYTPLNVDAAPPTDDVLGLYTVSADRLKSSTTANVPWFIDNVDAVNDRWAAFVSGL
jgi:putative spermidine/putrescine transport system substrate-binding protein